MLKRLAAMMLGLRVAGWVNLYHRGDGRIQTGSIIYKTKREAEERGLCELSKQEYIGTKLFYF